MYGGLFGDLPATKKDAGKKKDESSSGTALATSESSLAPAVPPPAKKSKAKATELLPRFIPTQAARPRPTGRKRPAPSALKQPVVVVTSKPTAVVNVHEATKEVAEKPSVPPSSLRQDSAEKIDSCTRPPSYDPQSTTQEPEYLRLLHERANENPYDPFVPNDLLQYWERKSLAKEREKLMRERQETVREQNELRRQLDQERSELEQSGNGDKILEHRMQQGMGRGRGRGMSNLPAWLAEKQRKEQEQQ